MSLIPRHLRVYRPEPVSALLPNSHVPIQMRKGAAQFRAKCQGTESEAGVGGDPYLPGHSLIETCDINYPRIEGLQPWLDWMYYADRKYNWEALWELGLKPYVMFTLYDSYRLLCHSSDAGNAAFRNATRLA